MSASAPDSTPFCDTLAIVGVGLIGGSIAAAARKRGLARQIVGVGRNREKLLPAVERGLLTQASDNLAETARQADVIVFCLPVDRIAKAIREVGDYCRSGTLLTDAGSTKELLCRQVAEAPPRAGEFVGAHPIAGSEKSGYDHACADLFQGRPCVVTPLSANSAALIGRCREFWQRLGARVSEMTPAAHDAALAEISHAPHVVASALARCLRPELASLVGSGFRDTTRIAEGDADLWTSILLSNLSPVVAALEQMEASLHEFQSALRTGDESRIRQLLAEGRKQRSLVTAARTEARTAAQTE